MIRKWLDNYQKHAFLASHRFLLVYAHIIAIIHGIGFLIQGTTRLSGPIKHALAQTEAWHGGLPALSVFSIALLAGLSVILLSALSLRLAFFEPKASHCILWLLIFISGGGFVYAWMTLAIAISLFVLKPRTQSRHSPLGRTLMLVLLFWLFASWLLGELFPPLMIRLSVPAFIMFDIIMPWLLIMLHRQGLKQTQP